MTVSSFEAELRTECHMLPGTPYLRPFAPNARWHNAEVFLVGTNPATPLRTEFSSFDEYWTALTRHPKHFYRVYAEKHPGKEASLTTTRFDHMRSRLGDLTCLVTNVCSYPAKRKRDVPKEQWKIGERILLKLIDHCRPKAILFQGKPAVDFGKKYFDPDLNRYVSPVQQGSVVDGCLLLAYHHFTGMGLRPGTVFNFEDAAEVFAKKIRHHVANA